MFRIDYAKVKNVSFLKFSKICEFIPKRKSTDIWNIFYHVDTFLS